MVAVGDVVVVVMVVVVVVLFHIFDVDVAAVSVVVVVVFFCCSRWCDFSCYDMFLSLLSSVMLLRVLKECWGC